MRSRKLWLGFLLWESLGRMIGLLIANSFSQPGGGFNWGPFMGAIFGMPLLWWGGACAVFGFIDYAKRE